MDTLYTFWDNISHYKTTSVDFLGLMNSATKESYGRVSCWVGNNTCGTRVAQVLAKQVRWERRKPHSCASLEKARRWERRKPHSCASLGKARRWERRKPHSCASLGQSKAMREKEAAFMRKSWQSKAMGEKEAEFESVCQCSVAEGSCSMCGRRLWDSHSFQQHEGSCPKKVAKP